MQIFLYEQYHLYFYIIYLFVCIKGGSLHFEIDDKCAEIHLNMIDSIVNEKYFSEINDKKAILGKKKNIYINMKLVNINLS